MMGLPVWASRWPWKALWLSLRKVTYQSHQEAIGSVLVLRGVCITSSIVPRKKAGQDCPLP